jgi:hypothetical protein
VSLLVGSTLLSIDERQQGQLEEAGRFTSLLIQRH